MGAINNFQASMARAKGFARLSRYEVILHPPAGLVLPGGPAYSNDISLFCDSIMMPGHDLNTTSVKFGTEVKREMVTSHAYTGTIDATFYLDHDLDLKEYFDAWQEQAVSTDRNAVSYYKTNEGVHNYVGSMEIHQLSSSVPMTDTTYHYGQSEIEGSQYKDAPVDRFGHELPISKTQKRYHETVRTYSIEVDEVFPETIAGIEYAYATVDEVAKLSVSFQYRKWKEIN